MATHVTMLENVATSQYLTFANGNIALHDTQTHPANFRLARNDDQDHFIEVYNSPPTKLAYPPNTSCPIPPSVSPMTSPNGHIVHTTDEPDGDTHVMVYFQDSVTNEKFFLRVNEFPVSGPEATLELVCQEYIDSLTSEFGRQEVLFNLTQVNENDISIPPELPVVNPPTETRPVDPNTPNKTRPVDPPVDVLPCPSCSGKGGLGLHLSVVVFFAAVLGAYYFSHYSKY